MYDIIVFKFNIGCYNELLNIFNNFIWSIISRLIKSFYNAR